MAATLIMTAVPAHFETSGRGYTTRVVEFLGCQLGRKTRILDTVADIRAAVGDFGKRVREAHPEASFEIPVPIGRQDRKPRGGTCPRAGLRPDPWDAAQAGNGFGQDDFMAGRERHLA